jgi:5-methylcytosine-specific restriction endonuclease McrBC GTP-binding regulatory subunit McrB
VLANVLPHLVHMSPSCSLPVESIYEVLINEVARVSNIIDELNEILRIFGMELGTATPGNCDHRARVEERLHSGHLIGFLVQLFDSISKRGFSNEDIRYYHLGITQERDARALS